MNPYIYTPINYINSKSLLKDKIEAIDLLINKMMESTLEGVSGLNSGVQEYSMDDGQIKVRTVYRSIDQMLGAVKALETLKQMYLNQLNGRIIRLTPAQSILR